MKDRKNLVLISLVILAYGAFLNFPYFVGDNTVDASWQQSLSYFTLNRFIPGKEWFFTYGPLAFLFTGSYTAELFWIRYLWEVVFKGFILFETVSLAVIFSNTNESRIQYKYAFAILLTGILLFWTNIFDRLPYQADVFYYFVFLVFSINLSKGAKIPAWRLFTYIVLSALISQIKTTLIVFALIIYFFSCLNFKKQLRIGWMYWLLFPAVWLMAWFMSGGTLSSMISYYRVSLELAMAHGESVSSGGAENYAYFSIVALAAIANFLLVLTAIGSFIRLHYRHLPIKCFSLTATLLALVVWKHGTYRLDGHLFIWFYWSVLFSVAFTVLLSGILDSQAKSPESLSVKRSTKWEQGLATSLILTSVGGLLLTSVSGLRKSSQIVVGVVTTPPSPTPVPLPVPKASQSSASSVLPAARTDYRTVTRMERLTRRIRKETNRGGDNLLTVFWPFRRIATMETAQEEMQNTYAMPLVRQQVGDAKVDVWGHEQGIALVNQLNLTPRPSVQGYQTFSSMLNARNREYFLSQNGPQYCLFKMQALDGRFLTSEDNMSFPVIMNGFTPILPKEEQGYLLLKRNKTAGKDLYAAAEQAATNQEWHQGHLEERITLPVPEKDKLVFLTMKFKKKVPVSLLYSMWAVPVLKLKIQDDKNREESFRIVPKFGESSLSGLPSVRK